MLSQNWRNGNWREVAKKLKRTLLCFPAAEMTEAVRKAPYTKGRLSREEVRIFSGALQKALLLIQRKDRNM